MFDIDINKDVIRRHLEIKEVKTVPYVPLSHSFVERLIGTVRREFLDHVLFWNTRGLARKLIEFPIYFNEARIHSSLDGQTPAEFPELLLRLAVPAWEYRWQSFCRGMYELPVGA